MTARVSLLAVLLGFAVAATDAEAATRSSTPLSANGRVGHVYPDRATMTDVRAAFGAPRAA